LSGQYFSNIPYSLYTNSDFWSNSPTLILIRVGICLLLMAGAYLWTDRFAGSGWSWMRTLGKNSLMVYWIHVQLVYSDVLHLKGTLNIPQTIVAALTVMALMVALSAAWIGWKERRTANSKRKKPEIRMAPV
jgi:peptidoglycan/LPS O-acetylase OafA/YrhL